MKALLNLSTSGTAGLTPCLSASRVRYSMTPATSMPCGQRVVHVWQEAHSHVVSEPRAISVSPNCTARMTWLGCQSKYSASGQPLVHFTH